MKGLIKGVQVSLTLLTAILVLSSCAKRTATVEEITPPAVLQKNDTTTKGIVKEKKNTGAEEVVTEPLSMLDPQTNQKNLDKTAISEGNTIAPKSSGDVQGLKDVFYEFNKATLRENEIKVLEKDADWLTKNKSVMIRVEGYADERGTYEYNLTLGEKRAQMVKKYLAAHGILASHIDAISYGEEKGFCSEHNEDCWSQNRRSHFVVLGQK